MNKQIKEIKKEFEEKFPELYVVVTGTPRLDGNTLTNRYKENAIPSVWNFIEQAITKSNEEAENRGWQLGFKKGYDEGLSNGRSLPISMTEAVALSGKQLLDIQYFKKQILEEFADILERKGWGDMTVEIETYLTQKENKDE